MISIPILGALALGVGTILDKFNLRNKKLGIRLYQVASFLALVLVMLPLIYFFWKLDAGAFELKNILIFVGIIISATVANLFIYYSEKGAKITSIEPAIIVETFFVIIITIVFGFFIKGFSETSSKIIIPTLIALAALIFPYLKKEHLKLNKYFIAALLGSFFFALELVLSKFILDFYSPLTFYFLRCLLIFAISWIIFMPNFKKLDKKSWILILITGAVYVGYRVATYYGYLNYGIILTTLITMLAPIVVYILANRFLKEKLSWKNILSSAIILGCVAYVLLA
ncbi:EamA-like transporter family protein [uncultured archaeon]|nr:EamA-like transporter family protein [uncultured archaeon]